MKAIALRKSLLKSSAFFIEVSSSHPIQMLIYNRAAVLPNVPSLSQAVWNQHLVKVVSHFLQQLGTFWE